jgi:hypothetical protein
MYPDVTTLAEYSAVYEGVVMVVPVNVMNVCWLLLPAQPTFRGSPFQRLYLLPNAERLIVTFIRCPPLANLVKCSIQNFLLFAIVFILLAIDFLNEALLPRLLSFLVAFFLIHFHIPTHKSCSCIRVVASCKGPCHIRDG